MKIPKELQDILEALGKGRGSPTMRVLKITPDGIKEVGLEEMLAEDNKSPHFRARAEVLQNMFPSAYAFIQHIQKEELDHPGERNGERYLRSCWRATEDAVRDDACDDLVRSSAFLVLHEYFEHGGDWGAMRYCLHSNMAMIGHTKESFEEIRKVKFEALQAESVKMRTGR